MSDESGRSEVYVIPFPKGEGKWQVSTDGGLNPIWAGNSRELFYRISDKMMVADYSATEDVFSAEHPRELFTVPTLDDGVILGTVGYMSPEQASGRPLDHRSDQFSLGSILYEMATGKIAFKRETAAQMLAAIIEGEPEPIAKVNPNVPPPICA